MEKVWRCTVCGYLHTGDKPPEVCPVCGADASKFVLVEEPEPTAAAGQASRAEQLKAQALAFIQEMKVSFVPHAVAAHFPNALLPTCFLFLLLAMVSGRETFEATAFYLLLIAFLSVPVTYVTGLIDWKTKYSGELAPIFRKKIILGGVLLILVAITTAWRWSNPQLISAGGLTAYVYALLLLAMLVCVGLLGHYGGVLVFGGKKNVVKE